MGEEGGAANYVKAVAMLGTEKKRDPEKFYVYSMRLTRVNNNVSVIYRRYSEFFEMHCHMIDTYRELVTSKPRWLPPLPKGGTLGRGNVAKVAEARIEPLKEYMGAMTKLDKKYLACEIMEEFFAVQESDLKYAQAASSGGKAEVQNAAESVGGPVALEEYVAREDYKPKDKKGVCLVEGEVVEVLDKSNSGWWYVSWSAGIGWVPANYLSPLEGDEEDYATCLEADSYYITTNSFKSGGRDEVGFTKGEIVTVELTSHDGWWFIVVAGKKGFAPSQYLHKLEGDVLKEDLANNPPVIETKASDGQAPPPRSNTHRRRSTRKAQKSMRSRRGPKTGPAIPEAPEGEPHVVVESYTSSGVGQLSLAVGDKVVVTNKAKEDWWYVWTEAGDAQGWFPSAFLVSETEIKGPEQYKVVSNYAGSSKEELTARKGQVVIITDQVSDADWWFGKIGKVEGWIPASFLQKI